MEFSLVLKPNIGYWQGGTYEFKFNIPAKYPFEGPKVTCCSMFAVEFFSVDVSCPNNVVAFVSGSVHRQVISPQHRP
jgi:ubiquitin-protein ligase